MRALGRRGYGAAIFPFEAKTAGCLLTTGTSVVSSSRPAWDKDILSPDRALTEAERQLLQELIDASYGQFVGAVAEGRGLEEQAVRDFADGRVFTGAQALQLGLVDALGDEETARRLAADLAGLDPEHSKPINFGRTQKRLGRLLPGGRLLSTLQDLLQLELATSGQPLWLHRP